MDAQLHTLILQMLQQTADGLASAVQAPIGEIETGGETAERFQTRMELSIKRIRCIQDIMQQRVVSPDQLTVLWNDVDDEREYHERQQQNTTGEREIDLS